MAYEEARALLASAYQTLEYERERCHRDSSASCRLAVKRALEEFKAAREEFNRSKVTHRHEGYVRDREYWND